MKPLTEHELELLERHLDGDLSAGEAEAVRQRSTSDGAWSVALEGLRAERTARQAVWQGMEPDRITAERFAAQAIATARRQEMRRRTLRALRGPAAAAACLVMFLAGWVARGQAASPLTEGQNTGATGGRPMLVGTGSTSSTRGAAEDGSVQVAITDEQGNIVAIQRFQEIDQARQFAEDLTRWQTRRQQAQEGRLIRVADEF